MQYVDYFFSLSFDSHWNEFQLEIWKAGIKLFFPLDSFISYTELNRTGENSYAYYSWKELRIQNADLSGNEHDHSLHAEYEFVSFCHPSPQWDSRSLRFFIFFSSQEGNQVKHHFNANEKPHAGKEFEDSLTHIQKINLANNLCLDMI